MDRSHAVMIAMLLACCSSAAWAEDKKDERAGTCSDAKQQQEYFCNEQNSASDSMVAMGTACTNAKKNVAAACEGKVEPDQPYQFEKK
ncbi:MAG: hypothetical protein ABI794_01675 [Betaproteobacteria bacterium]